MRELEKHERLAQNPHCETLREAHVLVRALPIATPLHPPEPRGAKQSALGQELEQKR